MTVKSFRTILDEYLIAFGLGILVVFGSIAGLWLLVGALSGYPVAVGVKGGYPYAIAGCAGFAFMFAPYITGLFGPSKKGSPMNVSVTLSDDKGRTIDEFDVDLDRASDAEIGADVRQRALASAD